MNEFIENDYRFKVRNATIDLCPDFESYSQQSQETELEALQLLSLKGCPLREQRRKGQVCGSAVFGIERQES